MHGPDIIRGIYHGEMFDVSRVPSEDEWGSYLLYRTGDKAFNIALRGRLKALGCKLNEHGLYGQSGGLLASKSEEEIFEALHIPFIAPEDRVPGKFNLNGISIK